MILLTGLHNVQGNEVEQYDITVIHVVQPGENLNTITRSYLGTDILWHDNWKLNPQIKNPNNLKIGQQLTVIKQRVIPAEKAKVFNVVNRVEKKPTGSEWLSAREGDELVEKEGVRTYAKSSALLEFNDESQLKVLEYSQIFLQSRTTDLRGTDSATIEVIKGDAELNWEPIDSNQTEITIVTGEMISKPQVVAGKTAELRTGITDAGKSLISVYQGNSDVANAGAEVAVKQGMGVAVKPGEVPVPMPLLQSPVVFMGAKAVFNYKNPWLSWSEVKGAVEYLVEICADENCQVVLKQENVDTNKWQINDFNQLGEFYYRVGAKSKDELVGFRSLAQKVEITADVEDVSGPVIGVDIIGYTTSDNQQLTVGPDSQITIYAVDELSGVAQVEYSWSGQPWQEYSKQMLHLPKGNPTLKVRAVDQLGLVAEKNYHFVTH